MSKKSMENLKVRALGEALPALDDVEGDYLPEGLPEVIDGHVHVFPNRLMASVRQWFDQHGWPIRYRMPSVEIAEFLLERGVAHVVLLHYAHQQGMARELNNYAASVSRDNPRVSALATVYPGEEGAGELLEEGFAQGLSGVKLHQHVQCFELEGAGLREVCEVCVANDKPLLAHLGREPWSPKYRCDPYEHCSVELVEELLKDFPGLKLCVPHLGADEFDEYLALSHKYDNLWLDTTMMVGRYFKGLCPPSLDRYPEDRVFYGTDFPNLPHAWDRELKIIKEMNLSVGRLEKLLGGNAREFYSL